MSDEKNVIAVGQTVPNFELDVFDPQRNDFGKISLDGLAKEKKWVILFFYPADFTFVCPTELADVAEEYEELKKSGAEVISVSTDTKYAHLSWHREEKLMQNVKFPMGADTTGALSKMFGVYDPGTGLALRGTFIINPDKKLVSSEVNFYNVGRNADELLRKISANSYLSTHTDEVCPSGWTKGKRLSRIQGQIWSARSSKP